MHLPAATPGLMQVMLDAAGRDQRHLQLLERPGHPQVGRAGQVRTARAGAFRVVVTGVVRLRPAHRRPRRAGLLAPLALLRVLPLLRAALLAGRLAARGVIPRRRHRGVAAVTRNDPLQPGDPVPQLRGLGRTRTQFLLQSREFRQLGPQVRDLRVAGRATSATRGRRRHLGHKT